MGTPITREEKEKGEKRRKRQSYMAYNRLISLTVSYEKLARYLDMLYDLGLIDSCMKKTMSANKVPLTNFTNTLLKVLYQVWEEKTEDARKLVRFQDWAKRSSEEAKERVKDIFG